MEQEELHPDCPVLGCAARLWDQSPPEGSCSAMVFCTVQLPDSSDDGECKSFAVAEKRFPWKNRYF